ncbi:YchJ family metal-binding protein [Kitasatospora sp. NBC_00240]|uniref:YchJ family protein n=1 Tax=Kitasatospora sp. NBC_00240 TaxID=2903567 RepID=UPI0022531E0D|nr:YchJ family metal-binding protein [Kitasatospora sp. NBC_00240]MCX5213784.1 YchJ family metal-binding protein [Kitasatospora sp. NBC_00240]
MSRRKPPPAPALSATAACPCGLPASYGDCCGRFHRGEAVAPTAERLMRSRYSAFVVRDEAYLLRSWHPGTRPAGVDFDPGLRWQRLEVHAGTEGGPFHTEGTVDFSAHFTDGGSPDVLREHSRFVRVDGAWVYLDALPPGR